MKRYFQTVVAVVSILAMTALAAASAPRVALRLSGVILSTAAGKQVAEPINRAVRGGEILRYTIAARNVGNGAAYQFSPIGKVPERTELLKLDAMPRGTRVAYSVDGKHWAAAAKPPLKTQAIRWLLARPLAPKQAASFVYEVRVK